MELYQDCGWFQTDSDISSAVEAMNATNADDALCNSSLGIWDGDIQVQGRSPDHMSTLEEYHINLGEDCSYNLNDYLIKKADSLDEMNGISSVGLASIIPISYKERLHGEREIQQLDVVKTEVEDVKDSMLYNQLWGEEDVAEEEAVAMEEEEDVAEEEEEAVAAALEDTKASLNLDLHLQLQLNKAELEMPVINTPDFDDMWELVNYVVNNNETPPVAEAADAVPSPSTFISPPSSVTSPVPLTVLETIKVSNALEESTINMTQFKEATIVDGVKLGRKRRLPKYVISEDEGEISDDDNDEDYEVEEVERPVRRGSKRSKGIVETKTRSEKEKRKKNNEASRKSRENRKMKEKDMDTRLMEEERRNVELRARADELQKLVHSHRQLLLQMVSRSGGGRG